MEIQNFKTVNKGCLVARFDVMVPQWSSMTIKDCALFQKEGKQWVSLPSRQYEASDGAKKHFELVHFPKEIKERFQTKCIELLKPMIPTSTTHPTASKAEEEAPF